VRLEAPVGQYADGTSSWRIHLDEFDQECRPEPDAAAIIARNIDDNRRTVLALMGEVRDLTARLGVAPRQRLGGEVETQAIAVRSAEAPQAYKQALVKAHTETLPELFKKIELHNKAMARWMKAELLPLQGQVAMLEPAVDAVKSRIKNVEIYAGLTEKVVRIRDGAPASLAEPIRLFQRRCYMDEECPRSTTARAGCSSRISRRSMRG
jgi:hypothetical protein